MEPSLNEEQKEQILNQIEKEEQDNEVEKRRLARAKHVMKDEDDQKRYGYTDKVIEFMRLSVRQYIKTLKIEQRVIRSEEDYIKIDDTWLKMSKVMLNQLRHEF